MTTRHATLPAMRPDSGPIHERIAAARQAEAAEPAVIRERRRLVALGMSRWLDTAEGEGR